MKYTHLFLLSCMFSACSVDLTPVDDGFEVTQQAGDWRGEIIYQIVVDRFSDGDPTNNYGVVPSDLVRYQGGDWQGIINNIDYLEALGVTTVWISPVVRNVEQHNGFDGYHGYWTQDFLDVNPHFGDLATLRSMVNALHERDILVIIDVVTNHIGPLFYYDINQNGQMDNSIYGTGTDSPLERMSEEEPDFDQRGVQSFTSLGEAGPAPIRWFHDPATNHMPPLPAVFQDPTWYNLRGRIDAWGREPYACAVVGIDNEVDPSACRDYVRLQEMTGDFPSGLRDIRTELPEVRSALIDVMVHWIEVADIDGFRVDTIKHVELEFWDIFPSEVRRRAAELGKTNFFMIGEAFDGRDALVSDYVEPNRLDSVFHFSQNFRVFNGVFIGGAPTTDIGSIWNERVRWYNDEPHARGIESISGGKVPPKDLLVNFLDNHDMPRFLWNAGTDELGIARLHAALAFMLLEVGIPCIYYGTEQQFSGRDDPMNRLPLWWTGFDRENSTFQWIAGLTRLRRSTPELMYGDETIRWQTAHVGNEIDAGLFAFERSFEGERALAVLNTSPTNISRTVSLDGYTMPVGFEPGTVLVDIMPNATCNLLTVQAEGCLIGENALGCLVAIVEPLKTHLFVEATRTERCR